MRYSSVAISNDGMFGVAYSAHTNVCYFNGTLLIDKLQTWNWVVLEQPPYPDMSPNDSGMFPKLLQRVMKSPMIFTKFGIDNRIVILSHKIKPGMLFYYTSPKVKKIPHRERVISSYRFKLQFLSENFGFLLSHLKESKLFIF